MSRLISFSSSAGLALATPAAVRSCLRRFWRKPYACICRCASMKRFLLLILIASASSAQTRDPSPTGTPSAAKNLVSVANGVAIYDHELEKALGDGLFRIRSEEYRLKRAVLEDLLGRRLLEWEARRRAISVAELERAEITDRVQVVKIGRASCRERV